MLQNAGPIRLDPAHVQRGSLVRSARPRADLQEVPMAFEPTDRSSELPAFFGAASLDLDAFRRLCDRKVDPADYPHAAEVRHDIPIYDGGDARALLASADGVVSLRSEWCTALRDGPGVIAIAGAFDDVAPVDRSTDVFRAIVADERAAGSGHGDHFGNNERIWNALQKVGLRDPEAFVAYYGNPLLALAAEAWLGPGWQMTAQMNTVKPGSDAQAPHRDYHLGFQDPRIVAAYPAHLQIASQYLTLQGAVAHVDMPLASGPTRFLPFSQLYPAGYLAANDDRFLDEFDARCVQIPFAKGDAVFFSPALLHGAGSNRSSHDRIANLLQISAAFGRPMESIDRRALLTAVYPVVARRLADGSLDAAGASAALTSAADGYSFPTNLDADPPIGGNAPETALQMAQRGLDEGWATDRLERELEAYARRRLP